MADITIKLIWYKLGELQGKMADAGKNWYTELDFDSYVLDLLLLGWCTFVLLVVVTVNALFSVFGPKEKQPKESFRESKNQEKPNAVLPVESAQWFNGALSWFYLHYYHSPEFVEDWLDALNIQINKLGGPVQARFDRIQQGSLPPKVTHVSSEASPADKFIIHAKLESRDLSFVVFTSQQTHEGVKLTNVTATVQKLKGTLRVEAFKEDGDVKVSTNFEGKPDIKVDVRPLNPYQETSELTDLGVVQTNVGNSIIMTKAIFTITHLLMPVSRDLLAQAKAQGPGPDGGAGQGSMYQTPPAQFDGRPRTPQPPQQHQQQQQQQQQPPQQTSLRQQQMQQQVQQRQVYQETPQQRQPSPVKQLQQRQPSPMKQQQQQQQFHQQQQQRQPSPQPQQQLQQQQQRQPSPQPQPVVETMSAPHRNLAVHQEPVMPSNRQTRMDQSPRRDKDRPFNSLQFQQPKMKSPSRPEGLFEPLEPQGTMYSPTSKHPRMVGDKRLLVKIIKANGLSVKDVAQASTVCMLSTDEPVQGYATSLVRHTQHPFWDEHFLFDITHDTQEVRVEVYDRAKPQADEFIGEAIVYIDDLRKTPSSRQILRLHPQPGEFEYNSGSVTAEFLFMDPSEADLLMDSMTTTLNNQLSPRRRQEVEAQGATLITRTSTTSPGQYEGGSPSYTQHHIYSPHESPSFSQYNNTSPSNVSSGYRGQQIPTIENSPIDDYEGSYDPYTDSGLPQVPPVAVKDDLELVRPRASPPASPSLKKARTLGGSLKKLFRRSRKRSVPRDSERSRESSLSRGSRSKGPSRDNSLTRRDPEDRAQSVS